MILSSRTTPGPHTQARPPQHTPRRGKAGKTRVARTLAVPRGDRPPRHARRRFFFARADASLRYFRRPAPICSDAQPVFGRTWGQCFFFLLRISVLSCPRFPLRPPPPPPPPPFLPRPPLTVGRGGDDHQASGVRADTHLRLRANQNPGRNLFPYVPGDPLLPRPRGASGKHTLRALSRFGTPCWEGKKSPQYLWTTWRRRGLVSQLH